MRTEEWERLIEEKGQKRGEKAGQEKERIRIICTNLQKGRSAEDGFSGRGCGGDWEALPYSRRICT